MSVTVVLHIPNSESVVGEIDELPALSDTLLIIHNPRTREGKDLAFIGEETTTVVWPIDKLSFIEVLSEKEDEEIIGFVRE